MTRLAIIEDEPKTRTLLRSLIQEHVDWVKVVGEADSVESGIALIAKEQPQVILLDVQMGDGLGFDLLSKLEQPQPHVIFVTAYNQYAIKALRAGAVDYIEKPIHPDELLNALKRTQALIEQATPPSFESLLQTLASASQKRIAVPTRYGMKYLEPSSITHVQAEGSYSKIYFDDGTKPMLVSRMLAEMESVLKAIGFVRPHRSYLINTAKVAELIRTDGGTVLLTDGTRIPFSKNHKEKALEEIRRVTWMI